MASIGPEDYGIGKLQLEKYLSETDEYLNVTRPVVFKDDIQKRAAKGNRILGRLDVLIESLNNGSKDREKWELKRKEVQDIVEKI